MSQQLIVLTTHEASYDDPIVLRAGETVVLSGRTDIWDGYTWIWATAKDGREGWIPDTLIEVHDGEVIAREDYSAVELTCFVGDVLTGLKSTNGWVWCLNDSGISGWVPSRNLKNK